MSAVATAYRELSHELLVEEALRLRDENARLREWVDDAVRRCAHRNCSGRDRALSEARSEIERLRAAPRCAGGIEPMSYDEPDDLPARLRRASGWLQRQRVGDILPKGMGGGLYDQAADEIERLRAIILTLESASKKQ